TLMDDDIVSHAVVWLLNKHGQPLSPVAYRGKGHYALDTTLAEGETFKVSVSATGYPDAISMGLSIPPPPLQVDSAWLTTQEEDFGLVYGLFIKIKDDVKQPDIYLAAPLSEAEGSVEAGFIYTGLDEEYKSQCGILDDEGWVFWKDDCYNGQETILAFTLSLNSSIPLDSVNFRFGTTSNSFYEYVDRLDQPDSGLEQTFGQPRPQASNIIGGFGIFATWNTRIFCVKL
ncbi:MAG: DUF4249 family protein, partial [Phaeodactylibacter sp.]|nr:DUF4249 family protein [Phaeodactylibacter sp.]